MPVTFAPLATYSTAPGKTVSSLVLVMCSVCAGDAVGPSVNPLITLPRRMVSRATVEAVVKQASDFAVHGQYVQGKLTSGENIADLGGLRLALRALRAQPGYDPEARVDGLTPTQRFFFAWAQCWRQNITKERALQLVVLDPHGPNELRCNGPLSNMSEFHEAFGVNEGSPMFRPVAERVDIW